MGRERRVSDAVLWGVFLLLGGIFILLNNAGFFGEWGALVWPILFAIGGLGFLGWHVVDHTRWGALVPGFTMLGLAATIYLANRSNVADALLGTIFIASIGLGFWLIFLFHRDQWWAVIPGGNLWVLGVVAYLNDATTLETNALGAVLFMGLGIVFAILYLLRSPRRPLWWAAIPAAALLLFGIIVFIGETGIEANYWPLLLIFLGLGLLGGQYWATRPKPVPPPVVITEPERTLPVEEMDMPIVIPLQQREPEPPAVATGRVELQLPPDPPAPPPAEPPPATVAMSEEPPPPPEEPAWWQSDSEGAPPPAAGEAEDSPTGDTPRRPGDA